MKFYILRFEELETVIINGIEHKLVWFASHPDRTKGVRGCGTQTKRLCIYIWIYYISCSSVIFTMDFSPLNYVTFWHVTSGTDGSVNDHFVYDTHGIMTPNMNWGCCFSWVGENRWLTSQKTDGCEGNYGRKWDSLSRWEHFTYFRNAQVLPTLFKMRSLARKCLNFSAIPVWDVPSEKWLAGEVCVCVCVGEGGGEIFNLYEFFSALLGRASPI